MYKGQGIHHIALGVRDLQMMKTFYQDTMGFDEVFMDFPEAEYPALHEVVRMPHPVYSATLINQSAGGIIVEFIQMVDPAPRPIRKDFSYGDIGLAKMTIAVSDVEGLYNILKDKVYHSS